MEFRLKAMEKKMRKLAKIVGIFVVMILSTSRGEANSEILIGDIFSIGGPTAILSTPYILAVDQAVKEINDSGGVLGRKLKIIRKNDKAAPSLSGTLAEELVTKDKVNFLIGGVDTGFCRAISEVAQKHKVLYFMSVCQSPAMTAELFHPYLARTTMATSQFIRAAAKYASVQLKGANKWVVISTANDYGKTVWKDFSEEMKKRNPKFEVVAEHWPMPAESDMTGYIAAISSSGADAIFSGLWGSTSVNFIKQGTPFGIFKKMKYVGNNAGTPEEINALGRDVVEGGIGPTSVWLKADIAKTNPDFPRWHKEFLVASKGVEPSVMTDFAYRTVYGLVAAIRAAGSTKAEDVVKVLGKGYKFKLPWTEITMRGCDHQAIADVAVGYTRKTSDKKRGEFFVADVYNGAEFYPSCSEVKKLQK